MYILFSWDSYTTDECGMSTYIGTFPTIEAAKQALQDDRTGDWADIAQINSDGSLIWVEYLRSNGMWFPKSHIEP